MSDRFANCTLAIIAGGRGSRLGEVVKAHLRWPGGRTILQRTMDVVGPLVEETLVVANDPAPFVGMRVVPDVVTGKGAPGGVHAACRAVRTEWVLALASDLPFVSALTLQQHWQERKDVDVVVACLTRGRLESLHAFYRAQVCADAFEPLLREGDPSFAELFSGVRTRLILDVPDPRSFTNVNTPDEMRQAGLYPPLNAQRS